MLSLVKVSDLVGRFVCNGKFSEMRFCEVVWKIIQFYQKPDIGEKV